MNGDSTHISSHREAASCPTPKSHLVLGRSVGGYFFDKDPLTLVYGVRRVGDEQREVPRGEVVRRCEISGGMGHRTHRKED